MSGSTKIFYSVQSTDNSAFCNSFPDMICDQDILCYRYVFTNDKFTTSAGPLINSHSYDHIVFIFSL